MLYKHVLTPISKQQKATFLIMEVSLDAHLYINVRDTEHLRLKSE